MRFSFIACLLFVFVGLATGCWSSQVFNDAGLDDECEAAFSTWRDAIADARDDEASLACDNDDDCRAIRTTCDACFRGVAFNQSAADDVDALFPDDCDTCGGQENGEEPQPCPEPEQEPVGCYDGSCR